MDKTFQSETMIYAQIEELRLQMQKIASDKDLTDPRVVSISEKLDLLIYEFYISQETINRCKRRTG
jgi:hypothetical protein